MWPSLFMGYSHCPWHNPKASREMASAQGTFYLRNTETLFAERKPVFQLNVRETEGQLSLDVCPFFPLYFHFSLFFLQFICTKHFHKKEGKDTRGKKGTSSIPKELPKELRDTKTDRKEFFLHTRDLEGSRRLSGSSNFFTCSNPGTDTDIQLCLVFFEHWDG